MVVASTVAPVILAHGVVQRRTGVDVRNITRGRCIGHLHGNDLRQFDKISVRHRHMRACNMSCGGPNPPLIRHLLYMHAALRDIDMWVSHTAEIHVILLSL